VRELLEDFVAATLQAAAAGWEGDFTDGPFICGWPTGEPEAAWGFAWKQDNNGETWVLTTEPLHDLAEWKVEDADEFLEAAEVGETLAHEGKA